MKGKNDLYEYFLLTLGQVGVGQKSQNAGQERALSLRVHALWDILGLGTCRQDFGALCGAGPSGERKWLEHSVAGLKSAGSGRLGEKENLRSLGEIFLTRVYIRNF